MNYFGAVFRKVFESSWRCSSFNQRFRGILSAVNASLTFEDRVKKRVNFLIALEIFSLFAILEKTMTKAGIWMTTHMKMRTLSIGTPQQIVTAKGEELITGICKQTKEKAFLSFDGFHQDDVADKKHHGGPDRAVCMYPFEHYAKWNDEFECTLPSAAFGENITASGMTEAEVCIGDIYTLGKTVIQVTQGRIPCSTIDQRLGYPVMKSMIKTGFTGYLCRVLVEGEVRSDDPITLQTRDPHGVTVLEANTLYFHDPKNIEGIQRVLAIEALAEDWREKFSNRLEIALKNN